MYKRCIKGFFPSKNNEHSILTNTHVRSCGTIVTSLIKLTAIFVPLCNTIYSRENCGIFILKI